MNWFSIDRLQRKDLLQLMIDATDEESKTKLSTGEIVADAVGFLLAGYETTSNALTFTSYLLGAHPGIQERLANEIQGYFEDHPVCSVLAASEREMICSYLHVYT